MKRTQTHHSYFLVITKASWKFPLCTLASPKFGYSQNDLPFFDNLPFNNFDIKVAKYDRNDLIF